MADAAILIKDGKRLEESEDYLEEIKFDLLKLNIEGGEYAVLNRLIFSGDINKINNIQVQFHKIKKSSSEDRLNIVRSPRKTHTRSWYFPWVWENWEIKK